MKFCMVTTFYPPYHFGGDAVYVYQLSNELASAGHQVDVIHCRDSFELAGQEPRQLEPDHPNVSVHTLHSPWIWLSPLTTQQTGRMGFKKRAIERIIGQGDFDVIHYHNISLVGGLEVLDTGDGIKLYSLHDYWLICPTHVLFRNRKKACRQPRCFRCQLTYKRPPQLWRSQSSVREAIKQIDLFLSGSRFCLDMHKERGIELRGEVLPLFSKLADDSAIDDDCHQSGASADRSSPYFLFVGRLEKLKGLQDVLPYFQADSAYQLLIAGSGNDEQKLRVLAQGSPNIRFLGQQSRSGLRALYQQAIATILPSLTYEISPQVVAESWSMKTPVIAREIGALKEIVESAGGGLCFTSPEELRQQLDRIGQDRVLRDRLGVAGHEAYQRDWTPGSHIGRYLKIIERIRESKHG